MTPPFVLQHLPSGDKKRSVYFKAFSLMLLFISSLIFIDSEQGMLILWQRSRSSNS